MLESIQGHDRWLDPPTHPYQYCDACNLELEDCENGLGCLRCAHCNQREGECLIGDCPESEHLKGCEFPFGDCSCRRIKRAWFDESGDWSADMAIQERHEK